MGLSAFTNQPGSHEKYDTVIGYVKGHYYGPEPIDEIIYSQPARVETCARPYPTTGFGRCTNWYREVRKTTSNVPAVYHRVAYAGDEKVIDYVSDHHISPLDHNLGDYIPPNPGMDNAESKSVTDALNNLTDHFVGIGADLAQARQTCHSFAGLASKAATFLNHMKRGNFSDAIEVLSVFRGKAIKPDQKNLANLWLELSYGWKPLASDLYEGYLLADAALRKPVPIKAIGKGQSNYDDSFTYAGYLNVISSSTMSARTELRAHIENPALAIAANSGLINPSSIGWELVPFSFVVDWFVPVGATLQAITAGVGLQSDGGFTSIQIHDSLDLNIKTVEPSEPSGNWCVFGGQYQNRGFTFRRYCYTSFPFPRFYADVTPYSTPRALNALALLRQLLD